MASRPLGPWQVSPIGLGLMNVSWAGGAATEPVPRAESAIAGIHAALDAGVTLFDTADIYAPSWDQMGHNEEFVREALATWTGPSKTLSSVVVATKGGITRSEGEVWGRSGSRDYLVAAAEASRERLGVEAIDLWQHHRLDPSVPFETQLETVLEIKARGIAREVGVSNYSAAQVTRALEIGGTPAQGGIVSVQNEFSPFYRHDLDVLAVCEAKGVAFLPWSPLGGSAKIARLPSGDAGGFGDTAAAKGVSIPAVVIAWLLAYSPAIIAIPGATRVESILECLGAASLELTEHECALLTQSLGAEEPRSAELEPTATWR